MAVLVIEGIVDEWVGYYDFHNSVHGVSYNSINTPELEAQRMMTTSHLKAGIRNLKASTEPLQSSLFRGAETRRFSSPQKRTRDVGLLHLAGTGLHTSAPGPCRHSCCSETNDNTPTLDHLYLTILRLATTTFLHGKFPSSWYHGAGYFDGYCCLPSDHRDHGGSAPRSATERQREASGPENEYFCKVFEGHERWTRN